MNPARVFTTGLLALAFTSHFSSVHAVPADLDDDGIPNAVEVAATLNPNNAADALLDLDGDGWTNLDEYQLGTGINDASDTPLGQPNPHQKVFSSDAAGFDNLGFSVALSGDTAVIGSPYDDDGGNDSGAAYVFTRIAGIWAEQAKLTASDADAGDRFGYSVGMDGDTVIVGAWGDDHAGSDSGSAYVFIRTAGAWSEQGKLTAGDAAAEDRFGYSVAVHGNHALVGAYLDDDDGTDSGSAYVFGRASGNWSEQDKVTASDAAAEDHFGISVALQFATALIGAQHDDDNGADSGSAYVFARSGAVWLQQAKLIAGDADADDQFGFSVTVDYNTAVIGAYFDDDGGIDSGSAYVFTRSGTLWSEEAKLTASDAAADDRFGYSVAVQDDTAVIGAVFDDNGGNNSGSAYVFERDAGTWTEQKKLTAADAAISDRFGWSVAADVEMVLVGAWGDADSGLDSGAAYFYFSDLDRDGLSDSVDADIDGDGIPNNVETLATLDPANAADALFDLDGDGWINLDEYRLGTGINASGDTPLGQANPHQKVFTSDNSSDFGSNVAIHGDTALISAYGRAYVFARSAGIWTEQARLSGSETYDGFGDSLAVYGDTAVIGAPLDDDKGSNAGAVYVFTRTAGVWTQQTKLTASDGADGDRFGNSVALDDDTVLIGAFLDDDNGDTSGSAYVFTRTAGVWTEQTKLTASDGADNDWFGEVLTLDGDTVLVSAYLDDDKGSNAGAVYVFTRTAGVWTEQTKLTASDGADGDRFGESLALDGDAAVIGASRDDSSRGAAYVFTRTAGVWTQQTKLTASDGADGDRFGVSVGLNLAGNSLLIGAYQDDDNGSSSGSAYRFTRIAGSWAEGTKLTASDGANSDFFGEVLAPDGDTVVIGATGDDDNGSASGSAYFFNLDLDWDGDGLLNADELNLGTDPNIADTDGDGLVDGAEVYTHGTNPLLADTDADGLEDGEELNLHGTNPLLTDTDDDGVNDGNEVNALGTNPLVIDTDGDGASDGIDAYPLDAGQFINAGDVNQDGDVDVRDLLKLEQLLTE